MARMVPRHNTIKTTRAKPQVRQVVNQEVIQEIQDKFQHNSKRCRLLHLAFWEKFRRNSTDFGFWRLSDNRQTDDLGC